MSLISVIETEKAFINEVEVAFLRLRDKERVSAKLHRNRYFFGLFSGNPYVDLWIHDYLTDDASWNDSNLKLQPEGKELLVTFLADFIGNYKAPFVFWSMWAGDDIGAVEESITPAKLLQLIENSNLSIKKKYRVSS